MVKLKKIVITRLEGPVSKCDKPREFTTWESASAWLRSQSGGFPKGGCYDKHDFLIEWDDGETYEGRMDCKHHTEPDNDLDVLSHVRDFAVWHSGRAKHPWCGEEKYREWMAQKPEGALAKWSAIIDDYLMQP